MFRQAGVTVSGSGLGEAERIQSMLVTPSFFRALRTQPMRGQLFTDAEGEIGQEKVVVLTHGFWQRVFGGQDSAIGQDLRLGGEPHRIVGVLAPDFTFIDPDIQLYRPAAFTARRARPAALTPPQLWRKRMTVHYRRGGFARRTAGGPSGGRSG